MLMLYLLFRKYRFVTAGRSDLLFAYHDWAKWELWLYRLFWVQVRPKFKSLNSQMFKKINFTQQTLNSLDNDSGQSS